MNTRRTPLSTGFGDLESLEIQAQIKDSLLFEHFFDRQVTRVVD